jgi:hypothetical protein
VVEDSGSDVPFSYHCTIEACWILLELTLVGIDCTGNAKMMISTTYTTTTAAAGELSCLAYNLTLRQIKTRRRIGCCY